MKDSLMRGRRWIYSGLGMLSIISLFFPTMVLGGVNYWFNSVFSYGWHIFLWASLFVIPLCLIIINSVPSKFSSNDKLNSILFGAGVIYTFILYPIFMKLTLIQILDITWGDNKFYLGIGTILAGIFLTLGLIFALWSIVDSNLAKSAYKKSKNNNG